MISSAGRHMLHGGAKGVRFCTVHRCRTGQAPHTQPDPLPCAPRRHDPV